MKKEIQIVVPNDYSAVSLKKYLRIQDDLETYKDDKEAQDAFLLWNLCGITPQIINGLDVDTISKIKSDLNKLLNFQEYELQRIIKIGDVEYGFEPNLANMAYGAYLDISKFETLSIDKNWSTIMNILYRPISKKRGALYEIETYTGNATDEDKWLDVTMDVHFGCFFFFNRIYKALVNDILKSLKEEALKGETQHPHIQQILHESGEAIKALQSLQEKIS